MRLGRIRLPARNTLIKTSQSSQISSYFYSKTRAKDYHPAGHSWPADREPETPETPETPSIRCSGAVEIADRHLKDTSWGGFL